MEITEPNDDRDHQSYCVLCQMSIIRCQCDSDWSGLALEEKTMVCQGVMNTFEAKLELLEGGGLLGFKRYQRALFPLIAQEINCVAKKDTALIISMLQISNSDLKNYLLSRVWDKP